MSRRERAGPCVIYSFVHPLCRSMDTPGWKDGLLLRYRDTRIKFWFVSDRSIFCLRGIGGILGGEEMVCIVRAVYLIPGGVGFGDGLPGEPEFIRRSII